METDCGSTSPIEWTENSSKTSWDITFEGPSTPKRKRFSSLENYPVESCSSLASRLTALFSPPRQATPSTLITLEHTTTAACETTTSANGIDENERHPSGYWLRKRHRPSEVHDSASTILHTPGVSSVRRRREIHRRRRRPPRRRLFEANASDSATARVPSLSPHLASNASIICPPNVVTSAETISSNSCDIVSEGINMADIATHYASTLANLISVAVSSATGVTPPANESTLKPSSEVHRPPMPSTSASSSRRSATQRSSPLPSSSSSANNSHPVSSSRSGDPYHTIAPFTTTSQDQIHRNFTLPSRNPSRPNNSSMSRSRDTSVQPSPADTISHPLPQASTASQRTFSSEQSHHYPPPPNYFNRTALGDSVFQVPHFHPSPLFSSVPPQPSNSHGISGSTSQPPSASNISHLMHQYAVNAQLSQRGPPHYAAVPSSYVFLDSQRQNEPIPQPARSSEYYRGVSHPPNIQQANYSLNHPVHMQSNVSANLDTLPTFSPSDLALAANLAMSAYYWEQQQRVVNAAYQHAAASLFSSSVNGISQLSQLAAHQSYSQLFAASPLLPMFPLMTHDNSHFPLNTNLPPSSLQNMGIPHNFIGLPLSTISFPQMLVPRKRGLTRHELEHLRTYRYSCKTASQSLGSDSNRRKTGACVEEDVQLKKEEAGSPMSDLKCMICLEDVEPQQIVRALRCQHEFHHKCIDKWLRSNRSCPICRRDAYTGKGQ